MLTVKKHIQYFYNQTILDRNVGQGLRMGGQQPASLDLSVFKQ